MQEIPKVTNWERTDYWAHIKLLKLSTTFPQLICYTTNWLSHTQRKLSNLALTLLSLLSPSGTTIVDVIAYFQDAENIFTTSGLLLIHLSDPLYNFNLDPCLLVHWSHIYVNDNHTCYYSKEASLWLHFYENAPKCICFAATDVDISTFSSSTVTFESQDTVVTTDEIDRQLH